MPKRKKKDPAVFDPTTAKDPAAEGSKEVVEAVEKFDKEQTDFIDSMTDEAPDNVFPLADGVEPDTKPAEAKPDEKPSEKPATPQEQKSTPEAKDLEKDTKAKAEGKPAEEPGLKVDVPELKPDEKPAEVKPDEKPEVKPEVKPADGKPDEKPAAKEPEHLTGERYGEFTVEVVTEDGAKQVPMENLVTTYQQFPTIQRKYQELKPIMDLAGKAQVDLNDVMPLLELGIQTYAKQAGIVDGTQPPVADKIDVKPAQADGYQGPFKDQEQDDYYKAADPDLWGTLRNNHQAAQAATSRIGNIEAEMTRLRTERMSPQRDPAAQEKAEKFFEDKIKTWSGDHTDYFSAVNIGEQRLTAFKTFIVKNHAGSGLKLNDLTPEFLSGEFARFDPKYNLAYMQNLAQKKADGAKDDSGMFAEGTGVRTQSEPLDEQQEHMTDMM